MIKSQFKYLILIIIFSACANGDQSTIVSKKNLSDTSFTLLSPQKTGVNFINRIQESPSLNHWLWDSMYNGGGVAIGDVNNDGLPDIYFTSNYQPDALYINKGDMVFEDVSEKSNVSKIGLLKVSSGVTMIDINNDGHLDIYVSKFGYSETPAEKRNQLLINNGDGTFKEMAKAYGIDNGGYTIQSTFFDYDKDGDLDLYVLNQPSNVRSTRGKYNDGEDHLWMSPETSDRLYRNNGNNTFTDVSKEAKIENFSYGLGVCIADLNQDGWPDIHVSNDYIKGDNLFINNQDGTFTDKVNEYFNHISNFSMGTDINDVNNDGLLDIATLDMAGSTHYRSKTNMPSMNPTKFWKTVDNGWHYQYMHNSLQLNNGNESFSEIAYMAGIAKTDWSWSLLMNDFNNDSYNDVFITNGIKKDVRNNDFTEKMKVLVDQKAIGSDLMKTVDLIPSNPMKNFMYLNNGNLTFKNVTDEWGFGQENFSNGAAYGDLDLDGDLDLVINNVNSEASIYENNSSNNFLRIKLKSSKSNRPVLNSKVIIEYGGKEYTQELLHSRGFLSMSENVIHFGLGTVSAIDKMTIVWADNNISEHSDVKVNTLNIIDQDKVKKIRKYKPIQEKPKYFEPNSADIDYVHTENEYDDYAKQLLLPYKQSEFGPTLSHGDINGDGLDDFYIGASVGHAGKIYTQNQDGSFSVGPSGAFDIDKQSEDYGSIFFDSDQDGDLDLYVVSGGFEFSNNHPKYQDRLYTNDGKGNFSKSKKALPEITTSGMAIDAGDFDNDGDLDLFIGGKVVPESYPKSPESKILRNDGGIFKDVTNDIGEALKSAGMITDAQFVDYDGDKDLDLILAGEWQTIQIFNNNEGKFTKQNDLGDLSKKYGLWFHVSPQDVDQDGDLDFIAGNLGSNIKFKASEEKPFLIYSNDFDNNGNYDIVLANFSDDQLVPVRGRECSSEQVPEIKQKFPTFEGFATASLEDIYDLKSAQKLKATTLYSGVFLNDGGKYSFKKFPMEAQISPINDVVYTDLNKDGKMDIIAGGNLYSTEVETTRLDAGVGTVMLSNGDGTYDVEPSKETGLLIKKNVKHLALLKGKDKSTLVIANNNDKVETFKLLP